MNSGMSTITNMFKVKGSVRLKSFFVFNVYILVSIQVNQSVTSFGTHK